MHFVAEKSLMIDEKHQELAYNSWFGSFPSILNQLNLFSQVNLG